MSGTHQPTSTANASSKGDHPNSDSLAVKPAINSRPSRERRAGLTTQGWTCAGALTTVLFLEAAPRIGLVDSFSMVPISEMATTAGGLLVDPVFLSDNLLPSLLAIGLSFVLAGTLGILVGLVVWMFPWARKILDPWLATYYAIPTFALYPLLVVLLGVGLLPIVLLGTLFAVVAMISATVDGLDSIPASVLRLTKVLEMGSVDRLFKVLIPAALPQISVGLRLALSYSLIMVLASEFVLSTRGIGHFISNAYNDFAIADMYAGVLIVFALALAVNSAFGAFLRRSSHGVST
jgi:NitT/TauT family transport system permease protein